MVDPIISTGLAKDWLERLLKSWSTLRKTREDELQEIRNVFGDPKLLADYYIEPDCQPVNPADHDEDESIRAFRQPVRVWLNRFLEGEFFERDGRNTVFVLSDAGMGKTSLLMMLKLTHLTKFWPSGLDFRLMKLGPETLEKLAKIQDRNKTVLLLDSLDEDPSAWGRIEERLMELLDATKSFRQVILTCRTQFFPEGSAAPIEAPYKVVVGGYICNLLYLSPFDNAQVEAYLQNVYPNHWRDLLRKWWKKEDNPKLVRARKVVEPMKSLRMRPMLLAHIDDLMQSDIHEWREFAVYEVLVRRWLLREQRKQQGRYTEDQLWELCEEVAVYLQASGKRVLSLNDLEAIRKTLPVAETLEAFDIGGRSLLNRTSDNGFRFSHYSLQEFLVARRLVSGECRGKGARLRATDQLIALLFDWVHEAWTDRLTKIPWPSLDVRDVQVKLNRRYYFHPDFGDGAQLEAVYLRGAVLSGSMRGAVLKDSLLEDTIFYGVDLAGSDLRRARLKGSKLHGVNLQGADTREASFEDCIIVVDHGKEKGETSDLSIGIRPDAEFVSFLGFPRAIAWTRYGVLSVGRRIGRWTQAGYAYSELRAENCSLVWGGEKEFFIYGNEEGAERWDVEALQRIEGPRRFGVPLAVGCYKNNETVVAFAPDAPDRRWGDIRIHRWDGSGIRNLGLRLQEEDRIKCMTWNPRTPKLAYSVAGRKVSVYEVGSRFQHLDDPPLPASSLAWGNNIFLSAVLEDGSVHLWFGERSSRFLGQETLPPAAALAWAPKKSLKENQIALLGQSGEVVLWQFFEGHQVRLPVKALAVAWHPQGEMLALASQQGAIEIWDVSGGIPKLFLRLFDSPPIQGLAITADGYVDGPPEALQHVRFADGEALYDLDDLPERHDPERVRQAMAILSP